MKGVSIRLILCLPLLLSACTYLKYTAIQADYARLQDATPSQVNLKHMLDRETFFVIGKTIDSTNTFTNLPLAIAAYSSDLKKNERVDTMFFDRAGTHFGLNLPPGVYSLLVFADLDRDGLFEPHEIVGEKSLNLDPATTAAKMVSQIEIMLGTAKSVFAAEPFTVKQRVATQQSLYYPAGTIRQLDDPVFDQNIATLGMYDPASFLEIAPTMFYALEEDEAHKIPVVFVHGIDASARSFAAIIDSLNRERYRPWFFYYPSGGDLDQLADFFYDLFLSGKVIPLGDMPMIVVAHSMGGLVVREALNKYQNKVTENKLRLFITIASPLGGHPAAKSGVEKGLMVLPAWRDLAPGSKFMEQLYRKPLPGFVEHQLFYAYNNSKALKLGENSDGVVPLSSQLYSPAQQQSAKQHGFNSGHVEILRDTQMISLLLESMSTISSSFPDSHIEIIKDGGIDVDLSDEYSAKTKHLIGYAGKYLVYLVSGLIDPFQPQQTQFVKAVQGKIPASTPLEKDFKKFVIEHAELVTTLVLQARNKEN